MILTIDNLDGLGAVDYSAAIDRSQPFQIVRTLNAPSTVKALLCLEGSTLKPPARRARIICLSDPGPAQQTMLFTGYLTTEPVPVYAGAASAGAVYRLALTAVSDEWLLDKQSAGALAGTVLGGSGGAALKGLLARLDPGLFSAAGVLDGQNVGVLPARAGAASSSLAASSGWSTQAGLLAGATYAAYRVLGGVVSLAQAGTVTHVLDAQSTGLQIAGFQIAGFHTAQARELANDVTLSGEEEAATYWQEIFEGDGVTTQFLLTGEPAAPSGGHARLVADTFSIGLLNLQRWAVADPGSHLALGPGGLNLSGGNGFDGQTTLVANDAIELGGTIVIELDGVVLASGSAGVLGGLYGGTVAQANCLAGFSVRQSGGNTIVKPMIEGVETGTPFTITPGAAYTFRLRVHCAELLRVRQAYYARVDSNGSLQVQGFGGGLGTSGIQIDAPLSLVFEVRDLGESSNTIATILYDGAVQSSYAAPRFCAVNSVQLFGSIAAVSVVRTGTAWVSTTDPVTGATSTRLAGRHLQGAECSIVSSATNGNVTFFPGLAPQPQARLTVSYRGRSRSVARLADAASLAAEAAGSAVGSARWLGRVVHPPARSTEDCENAAQAVLAFATDRAAAVAGSCQVQSSVYAPLADVWPGDVLALAAPAGPGAGAANDLINTQTNVVARKVTIEEHGAVPEVLDYRIAFANDWAEGLGIGLSEAIAADAELPETALKLTPGQTPASSGHVLANLQQLAVVAFTGSGANAAITVDAGTDPPAGGGFEVRRHNGAFGAGAAASVGGDLVLRSPVRGFTIPRAAFEEQFFVRMYDAATPPHYSRQSAAIVTHLPLG